MYKESKDPNNVIFNCQGYLNKRLKPVIEKPADMSREEHSSKVLPLFHEFRNSQKNPKDYDAS